MVGMAMAMERIDDLEAALRRAYPELAALHDLAGGKPVYLVGGAVRDLLLGRGRADIDLVVEGDATALAARLGGVVVEHERFATAKAQLGGHEVDIATARAETYARPGALPEVEPTAGIAADLARRDFTINAMAIPLRRDPELIDPHGGLEDLDAGMLRVLHSRSFEDDPTRALRAARYVARFDFELEPDTAELLRHADLGTVSTDRRDAELLRLAGETEAVRGFGLLAEWGLIELGPERAELAGRVAGLLMESPWIEVRPARPGGVRCGNRAMGQGGGAGRGPTLAAVGGCGAGAGGRPGRAGPGPGEGRGVARPLSGASGATCGSRSTAAT